MTSLHLVPVPFAYAAGFVDTWHRTHKRPPGCKFCVGVADHDGVLRGVAIVGRPVSRMLDNGATLEVTRTTTDGTRNANSMLYGAVTRATFALGYTRLITYTQRPETGASLRAAGWRVIAERPARPGWTRPSRPRAVLGTEAIPRTLWEAT
ncbi:MULTISPECIES: XF1762 family protein [unclassified Amycolatopsis]|uniref:XF1762 family protein n=1 Tax=unclassified Amycolatopsis TaxID=2618356 RepID=UPI00287B96D9|nr:MULTISPECIES: XF1762 family protein [unclassified Amycolatopsis]